MLCKIREKWADESATRFYEVSSKTRFQFFGGAMTCLSTTHKVRDARGIRQDSLRSYVSNQWEADGDGKQISSNRSSGRVQ